jgi:hypothetical protein
MVEAVTITLRRLSPLVLLAALAFPAGVFAHRLDEYLQATLVVIEADHVRLQINLTPGVEVAEAVLAQIDRDHDGAISTNEAAAYAELVRRDLSLGLDGRQPELKLTASTFPDLSEIRAGWGIIHLEYSANPGSLATGAHTLTLQNRHLTPSSVYLFNAARPSSDSVQITTQERNANQSVGRIDFTFQPPVNGFRTSGIVTALSASGVGALAIGWWLRKRARSFLCADREKISLGIVHR